MEFGHRLSLAPTVSVTRLNPRTRWINVIILIMINFLNYSDRYCLAGILPDVQEYFDLKNDLGGFILTIFITVYMLVAPIFGYFGDRYSRKYLLALGIFLWNVGNVSSSFVTEFWAFILCRVIFSMGQACWTTIAPSIISDLFVGDLRSQILTMFYVSIPVGSGLAYIVSTQFTVLFGDWKWALRVNGIFGIINILLILIVLKEPKRGEVEEIFVKTTPWTTDVKYLLRNKSFLFVTLGFTATAFCQGAVSWWGPTLNNLGFKIHDPESDPATDGSIFGAITAVSGFFGLMTGYLSIRFFSERFPPITPIACGTGLLLATPILIAAAITPTMSRIVTYCLLFIGFIFMNMNWALTMDITFQVVVPSRRSSAVAFQLLIGHTFGDAGSPYLTGLFSDVIKDEMDESNPEEHNDFYSLQYAYFFPLSVQLLGALLFYLNAVFFVSDMKKVKDIVDDLNQQQRTRAENRPETVTFK